MTKVITIPGDREFKAEMTAKTDVTCYGTGTAKVTFKVQNIGAGNYNVVVDGGAPIFSNQTAGTIVIPNLSVGNHTIEFNHSGNCKVTRVVTITQPAKLTLSATITEPAMCSNGQQARVTLVANGGVPPYRYQYTVGGGAGRTQTTPIF